MIKKILDYKAPIIVLLCFFAIAASSFAWQYWLNPLWRIVDLPIMLLLPYFTLAPVFSLLWKKNRTKKTIGVIGAIVLVWITSFTVARSIPNGVAVRLSQYSERDFQEISSLIEGVHAKHRGDSEELGYDDEYDRFIEELKESHEIFNLSTFPVRVEKGDDHTSIGWYGGLAGGYNVVIFEKAKLPEWLSDYNVVHMYDTVAYYEIEDYANDY